MAIVDVKSFEQLKQEVGGQLSLASPIAEHAKLINRCIYLQPYARVSAKDGIARYVHGAMHTNRTAHYIIPVINYLCLQGERFKDSFDERMVKILQLMALFHDSGREDEDKDFWDKDSAINFYNYLTIVLGMDKSKTCVYAEFIANKDPDEHNSDSYYKLEERDNGKLEWRNAGSGKGIRQKNIMLQILHDVDCLDIIRARDWFQAEHLYLYQNIARHNKLALDQLAILITQIRSLINTQGDGRQRPQSKVKKNYEHENCYQVIARDIAEDHKLEFLRVLYNEGRSLIDQEFYCGKKGITQENLTRAMQEGKLYARGIPTPSAIVRKENHKRCLESATHIEVRKTLRRGAKDGNPFRSISMLGYGAATFSNAGFLLVDPQHIKKVSEFDCGTGRGKKEYLAVRPEETANVPQQLEALLIRQKMGGIKPVYFGEAESQHSEILCDLKKFDAIYFCQDYCLANGRGSNAGYATHPYSAILQAIYLQKEYAKHTGKILPIFEYSGVHNFVAARSYTNEDIAQMWCTMFRDYLGEQFQKGKLADIISRPLDEIKPIIMYGSKVSAIDNYVPALRDEINKKLETLISWVTQAYSREFWQKINDGYLTVVSEKAFSYLYGSHIHLSEGQKDIICTQLMDVVNKYNSPFCDMAKEHGEIIRAYKLAKKYELADIQKCLQKIAVSHIEYYNMKSGRLILFCTEFDLPNEDKENIINKFFDKEGKNFLNFSSFNELLSLSQKGLITEYIKDTLSKIYEGFTLTNFLEVIKINKNDTFNTFMENAQRYMKIAHLAGCNQKRLYICFKNLLNYIIHKGVSIGVSLKGDDIESFKQILSIVKSPLDDSDFYIVDFILKNCIFKMPIGLQEHEIIIYKAKEFNSLRQYLPHKQFTPKQIRIINQRIEEGWVFSYNNFSIEDNIQIINTYLEYKFLGSVPEPIKKKFAEQIKGIKSAGTQPHMIASYEKLARSIGIKLDSPPDVLSRNPFRFLRANKERQEGAVILPAVLGA